MNLRLPVYDERGGAFARLRHRRVLIYWPHGLGDYVHLGAIVPLLEPSNTYFITRYGDDFVHLYDGCEYVAPLFSGVARTGDGSAQAARHLGIDFKRIRNREETLVAAEPLATRMRDADIDTVLYTDYPDRAGSRAFPYHTKARALARALIESQRLAQFGLEKPLRSVLPLHVPASSVAFVEARLRTFVDAGERLYLVAPGGHTNANKLWPEDEALRLARRLRERDPRARVLQVDERTAAQLGRESQALPTTTDLFGTPGTSDVFDVPFAHLLTVLIRASVAVVGVPAGPLHLALAIGERPIVGIWLAHHPDWYDEPCASAIHLLGPQTYRKKFERRAATRTLPQTWQHRILPFRDHVPTAEDVVNALEQIEV